MKGTYAGLGLTFGAALGLLLGLMFDGLVIGLGMVGGAAIGLLIGSVIEHTKFKEKK